MIYNLQLNLDIKSREQCIISAMATIGAMKASLFTLQSKFKFWFKFRAEICVSKAPTHFIKRSYGSDHEKLGK